MPQPESVSSSHASSQIQSQEEAKRESNTKDREAQSQCEDCLKSSKVKSQDGKVGFNKTEAIEKLDLLKQTIEKVDIKDKIEALKDQVHQADTHLLSDPIKMKNLVDQVFQSTQQSVEKMEASQMALLSDSANPFKVDNPFAAKVIQKTTQSSKIEDKPKDNPQFSEEADEPDSFFKKLNRFFSIKK